MTKARFCLRRAPWNTVAREHAGESVAEIYGLAQCLTLLELADKYPEDVK